jgi:hypothetical protein
MRGALIILLLAAVGGLCYWVHSMQATIASKDKQIRELSEKARTSGIELQGKCAERAALVFRDWGWAKKPNAWYENHYNEELGKCFVLIADKDAESTTGMTATETFVYRQLFDAFEGKQYADYGWHFEEGKGYSEAAVDTCEVTARSGEKRTCKSQDEFDALAKTYMQ